MRLSKNLFTLSSDILPALWLDIKNLFFPNFCTLCGIRLLTEENGYFCPACWLSALRIEPPICLICGRPHPARVGFGDTDSFPCAECRNQKKIPYSGIRGVMLYDGAAKEAIKLFKFFGKKQLLLPLSEWMLEYARDEIACEVYDLLVPVPLYKVRLRERGFNQSKLLAEQLLPLFPNARLDESLQRIRPTKIQSRLKDPEERRKNVAGAFKVNDPHPYQGKHILVIDDVVTTGETVAECARVLQKAGAARVDVFAIALAVRHSSE